MSRSPSKISSGASNILAIITSPPKKIDRHLLIKGETAIKSTGTGMDTFMSFAPGPKKQEEEKAYKGLKGSIT